MTPALQSPAPRRHVWRWVLLGAGICLTPFLLLGIAAISYLTLERDVRLLREHVMAATDANWSTKIQMSVGRLTLGVIGQGLRFVHQPNIDDARLALRAVRHASVGVYETNVRNTNIAAPKLLASTDSAMRQRGWTRLVGVADKRESVLVDVREDLDADEPINICVAVVNGKEMVVASTTVDAAALGELVARHAGDDIKSRLHFAKLKF